MAKMDAFTCLHRVVITPADLAALRAQCETTEDAIHIPGERLMRFTLRGVPAKRVDVALPAEVKKDRWLVLEIGTKRGRFDGAERCRLTVRHWGSPNYRGTTGLRDHTGAIPAGRVFMDRREGDQSAAVAGLEASVGEDTVEILTDACADAGSTLTIAVVWADRSWSQTWGVLRSSLRGYDLAAIVIWHRDRYYSFLEYDLARALADSFEAVHPGIRDCTLAEANRLASRDLYRLARDQGWRKLTLRERLNYGFRESDPQWMRVETIERRRAQLGYPSRTGAGQYTTEAANAHTMTQTPADGYIQTAHGRVEVE